MFAQDSSLCPADSILKSVPKVPLQLTNGELMALVTYVLGNCPGCRRKDSFGNVDVFGGNHVFRGCKSCNYKERIPLPKLKKKIAYLDQFFFSHAFRGQEPRFLDAATRIQRASALQLLIAPYSSIHEDETHLWSGRDELFRFIKTVSRGHSFRYAQEVHRFQLLRAFKAWRSNQTSGYELEENDAFQDGIHGWDGYMRIDVGRYLGDIELIRSLKNESAEGLIGLFDGWRKKQTTFEANLQAEYEVAAKGYIDFYIQYLARMTSGDHSALLDSPIISMVVESMTHVLSEEGVPADQWLRLCAQFLMQSEHFKQTPHQLLSARMHATVKSMVQSGKFTNKELAWKKFKGYFYDADHISTYAPYCDVFIMDQLMADIVRQPTVGLEKRYGVKVFSLNNWPEFLEWLESLEQDITPEHRAGLDAAYPSIAS